MMTIIVLGSLLVKIKTIRNLDWCLNYVNKQYKNMVSYNLVTVWLSSFFIKHTFNFRSVDIYGNIY